MSSRLQRRLASGVATVAVGAVALAPISPATASAASTRAVEEAPVTLSAGVYDLPVVDLLTLSAQRTAEAALLAPLIPVVAALGAVTDDRAMLSALFLSTVDAPLWALDPALEAIAETLPRWLGGGTGHVPTDGVDDGAILQFRNTVLVGLRDDARALVEDIFGPPASPNANPVAAVAVGLAGSAERLAESLVLAPLGVIPVAQGAITSLSGGGNKDLYLALQNYIDGPQYVLDPTITGLSNAFTPPIGGPTGRLIEFRNTELIGARDKVRKFVADALGVQPGTGDPITTSTLASRENQKALRSSVLSQKEITAPDSKDTKELKRTDTKRSERKSFLKAPGKKLDRLVKKLTGNQRGKSDKAEATKE